MVRVRIRFRIRVRRSTAVTRVPHSPPQQWEMKMSGVPVWTRIRITVRAIVRVVLRIVVRAVRTMAPVPHSPPVAFSSGRFAMYVWNLPHRHTYTH